MLPSQTAGLGVSIHTFPCRASGDDPPDGSGLVPHDRLRADDGLYLVGQDLGTGKLVALLDAERERWRDTAVIWNLLIDRAYRRHGLGRGLVGRALAWAREQGLRGLVLESQTNNMPACRFYQAMGFKLCGLDDHFYSDDDIGVREVAIFWWYELNPLSRRQTEEG